jgi:glycosyltransferase involved in cell wall biosynthesis
MRVLVGEFDLADPAPIWGLRNYGAASVLVRNHGQPIGSIWLPTEGVSDVLDTDALKQAAVDQLHDMPEPPEPAPAELPPITVVVCTRDRPISLGRCLESLKNVRYPLFEVIVVDNASKGPETRELTSQAGFRYEREDRSGLDPARNCGFHAAQYQIVAYTDDDVRVDPDWLIGVARGFADPGIACVTGLIRPMELETPAQVLFEHYGGMGKGYRPRIFDPTTMPRLALIGSHQVGVGANMSFRREVLHRLGGFDPHLDVGTPSNGAGDLDMFHRLLAAGLKARYEPTALVWHQHRRATAALYKQVYNNGRSLGCYLMKVRKHRTVPVSTLARFVLVNWIGKWLLGSLFHPRAGRGLGLIAAEAWGAMYAPWAYLKTYGKT